MPETKLKLGSLFSGIGGFELVGSWYGIEPVWASEIEAAPIRITKRHFPNMKHLGDITKIHGDEIEPVDVLTGGSPCQDLSIAGKQSGIKMKCEECGTLVEFADSTHNCPNCGAELTFTRSGLFMEQMRIIREMRKKTNECYPKIVIWENVSNALSSNNGDDFFCVLQEFCKLMAERIPPIRPEKWTNAGEILGESYSIAWRILDAQYWGVPQRRRRIFLVADFTGQRAGEILFKPESLRRHLTPSKAPWKGFAAKAEKSIGTTSGDCQRKSKVNTEIMIDKCPTLTAANGTSGSNKPYVVLDESEKPLAFEPGASSRLGGHVWEDVTGTLTSQMGDNQMSVVTESESTVYGLCSVSSNSMKSDNPNSGFYEADVSKTLDTNGLNPTCNQGGNVVVEEPVYCIQGNCIDRSDTAGCNGKGWKENVSYTLTTIDRPAVVYGVSENMNGDVWTTEERVNTLTTGDGKPGQGYPCVLIDDESKDKEENPYVAAFAYQQGGSMPTLPYGEKISPPLLSSQKTAVLIDNHSWDCRWTEAKDNICPTLTAAMGTGGNNTPFVLENPPEETITAFGESGFSDYTENKVSTLKATGGHNGGGSETLIVDNDYTMTTGSFMQICKDKAPTLMAGNHKNSQIIIRPKSIVRRLTPLECERLQGFPDGWTEGESDAARYKALGNSVALPCVDYIMSGVADMLDLQ